MKQLNLFWPVLDQCSKKIIDQIDSTYRDYVLKYLWNPVRKPVNIVLSDIEYIVENNLNRKKDESNKNSN